MSGNETISQVLQYIKTNTLILEDQISLTIPELGLTITNWIGYDFATDWLDATSSWHVSIADGNYQDIYQQIQNKMLVQLKINDSVQATGFIDHINIISSANGGTILTISGRDALSLACDATIDPKYNFDRAKTVLDLMKDIFLPSETNFFQGTGFASISENYGPNIQVLTNSADQATYDVTKQNPISISKIDLPINKKYRPHWSEGVYSFAERLGKRFGFHIWGSADGQTLYCGQPDFTSEPIGQLNHYVGNGIESSSQAQNNIISSSLSINTVKMPTVIVGFAGGGGGPLKYQPLKCIQVNELLSDYDTAYIASIKEKYQEAKPSLWSNGKDRRSTIKRPTQIKQIDNFDVTLYHHDDEAKTLTQLQNSVRNIMAHYQSQCFVYHVTVNGHTLGEANVNNPKAIWGINTMVTVNDDVNNIHQDLWIKSRRFIKDVNGGTRTELTCILPYSLQLFPENSD